MGTIMYKDVAYAGGAGGGGHEIYYGTTVPASALGASGDMYIRLDTNGNMIEEYIKLGNNWTLIPKSDAVIGTKTITQNGTYSAITDSLDGYSSVDVNVSGGGSTLITKSITQNGTYNAQDDSADGYSQVTVNVSGGGGAGIELLFTASENSVYGETRNTDHTHIAYFDDGTGTITPGANYSNYLSYDSSSGLFTVAQGFTALIIPWVYNYNTASSSYSHGAFYINNTEETAWMVDYRGQGYYAGAPLVHTFDANDTFYYYTPVSDGWPEANLKVYKIDSSLSSLFNDMITFKNMAGGVGKVIT